MSKRSYRRLAALTGAALAVGSITPAMALRLDGGAGAGAEVDPEMIVNDVVNITGALPLPELGELPVPSYTQVNGTVLTLGALGLGGTFGVANNAVNNADNIVAAFDLGGILPDCGLVAVASCNTSPASGNVALPVSLDGVNVLGGGILNNTGDLGVGVLAPIAAPVAANVGNVLSGNNLLGLGLLDGGLGGILDADVSVLAGVLASL